MTPLPRAQCAILMLARLWGRYMGVLHFIVRISSAAFIVLAVAACAQRYDRVAVGIGTGAYKTETAAGYAALYRPYAQMAALAYTDQGNLFPKSANRSPLCPDAARSEGLPTRPNWLAGSINSKLRSGTVCLDASVTRAVHLTSVASPGSNIRFGAEPIVRKP